MNNPPAILPTFEHLPANKAVQAIFAEKTNNRAPEEYKLIQPNDD